ncbi:MAG: phosphate ABC transporter permease subunit PstC [Armatimonadota bacterium]|nr:MAG: phosphate ABC transporter permease subunit PstC [Armatimonadota bacterium]
MAAPTVLSVVLVFATALALLIKAWPILATKSLGHLLVSSSWHPLRGEFGFYPFIIGTLWVTGLAMAISVPICLLTAVYLAEYAGRRMRAVAKPLVDLLAGIPPVVYGLWGVLAVVPVVGEIGSRMGAGATGYTVLAGGIVLAIMVFPIVISVTDEVLRSVPIEAREASLALGATKWQTVKRVVIPSVMSGVAAAIVLGFSRAFGETMAVLMVVGNVAKPPHSVFDPAYPLPALIANNYGEMMSIRLYDSAIMLAALILLVVVLVFNVLAALVLRRVERGMA